MDEETGRISMYDFFLSKFQLYNYHDPIIYGAIGGIIIYIIIYIHISAPSILSGAMTGLLLTSVIVGYIIYYVQNKYRQHYHHKLRSLKRRFQALTIYLSNNANNANNANNDNTSEETSPYLANAGLISVAPVQVVYQESPVMEEIESND
jgi:hypothetical protein